MLYFDHNATSPLDPAARAAWLDASEKYVGNPSSLHRLGGRAEAALRTARERLADILGCHALDIVWTSGATEAANAVLHHAASVLGPAGKVWVSAIEHPCMIEPAAHRFSQSHRLMPVTLDGMADIGWLREQFAHEVPGLVAVQAANNETGVLQPWIEALALCREHGVPFLCDATQWLGKLPARGLGECDFLIGSAHKFGGPRGVGFLKCPSKGRFHPLLRGGGQEDGRRAGTENVAGVLSMLAALEAREAGFAAESTERVGASQAVPDVETIRERIAWREQFEQELLTAVPGARIAGAAAPRLWNTVSVIMPDMGKQPRWVIKLDKTGFAVSTGSACASGREKPSHVLDAMGCTASEASRALRFSSGWQTTKRDWSTLLEALERVFLEETRDSAGTRS